MNVYVACETPGRGFCVHKIYIPTLTAQSLVKKTGKETSNYKEMFSNIPVNSPVNSPASLSLVPQISSTSKSLL